MTPPTPAAPFFTEADQGRRNLALWQRLGWWNRYLGGTA